MLKWTIFAMPSLALCTIIACGGDDTAAQTSSSGSGAASTTSSSSSGQGGGGQGGGAQGGGGQGGSSAQGGGGQGGGSSARECVNNADCALDNDCCQCAGVPQGTDLPCADNLCKAPMCAQHGPGVAAQCRLGRCVTTIDCDLTQILCKVPEPKCAAGYTPSYNAATHCYGPCVAATECATVGDCNRCGPSDACVAEVAQQGPVFHCIPVPTECNGVAGCACMGATVCDDTYDVCDDSQNYLSCSCSKC